MTKINNGYFSSVVTIQQRNYHPGNVVFKVLDNDPQLGPLGYLNTNHK